MKIIVTSPVKYKGERHEIGTELDVSDKIAKGLFAAKSAERVNAKAKAKAKAEGETETDQSEEQGGKKNGNK